MSIFHELQDKIILTHNWKDNLTAHKKYENLYKKNTTEMIYRNIYRLKSKNKMSKNNRLG